MKSKLLVSMFGVVVGLTAVGILPAKAEQVCQVTDPTETSLNVRDRPNGQIVYTLSNGTEVYIHDLANDDQGRPWARVGSYDQGEYRIWGWVIREFLSCYNR
jgi:Bacterial SH3 domain